MNRLAYVFGWTPPVVWVPARRRWPATDNRYLRRPAPAYR